MNIYVGNLPKDASDAQLESLFAVHGAVKSVKIIRDMFSGESKGFGFVEMPGQSEAQAAIAALNSSEFMDKRITVNEARPKTDNRGGGGRSGGPRSGGGGRPGGGGRRF